MKQQLRRLKGTTIGTSIGQIVLKEYTRVQQCEYDQIYFTTNQEYLLCKVYNITNQTSIQRYEHEKQIYEMQLYPNLARCINKTQHNIRKINYGIIVLDQLPKNASLIDIGNSLSTSQLLLLTKTVLELVKQLKNRNQVYLNLRPQNIYLNSQKNFVIINPQYICQKGSHSILQDCNELFFSNVEKYFKYNSPQVLDNYTYFNIDTKSDCFSLGCILYEIIYGRYPFQSKFANINIIYEMQEGFFGKFIGRIFKPFKERAEVEELLKMVEDEMRKNPNEPKMVNTSSTAQSNKSTKNVHSIFDDISSVFNKYTKQTQGAYINFTQDNESFPQAKHLGAILNKLYKNPNKIQKLQNIMSKHIKATQYNSRKNFIIKNLVLILLLLRKNRNYMIHRWRDNINEIKCIMGQKSQCRQFCQLLIKKISLQQELNCILRGNFYLQDLCQFKLLTIGNLNSMMRYLQTVIIFATNLLMYKQDDYLFHYVLQTICDEMYDLISMIIFSVISLVKDNQLGLRKDNLGELNPLEKMLNVLLKKINNLSNRMSSHPIYSIQPDYYNYKEDIYLKQQPQYTSFQYFVKNSNYYKGLALPQINNFSSFNDSQTKNQFGSFDNNDINKSNKSQQKSLSNKFYGNNDISSDEDQANLSKKYIGINQVVQFNNGKNQNNFNNNVLVQQQKQVTLKSKSSTSNNNNNNLNQSLLSVSTTTKPTSNNINNLFGNDFFNQSSQTIKKAKSSQKPFTIFPQQQQNKPQTTKISSPKMGFDDFTNFFNDSNTNKSSNNITQIQKKDTINNKSIELKQNKSGDEKKNDIFQNFSFFHQESNKKKAQPKQDKKPDLSNWIDFNQPSRKITQSQKQQKQGLKIDPKILKQDIFNYDWLKKSQQNPFGIFVQPHENKPSLSQQPQPQKLSPFINEIISSLKLKQLKDLILNNKQVAIQFDKLIFDKVIGSGSAGQVYLGKYQNQAVAIKKVKIKQNPNALKQFERQLVTYIKIKKNPYLVSLIGLSKSGEDFYLLTEFCSGGSLFDLLHKKAGQIFLTWKTKMSLILQIAKGMKALHDMRPPIIHRDLKSLNVFIAQQNNQWIAKVADFGLSRSPEAQMMTMALGTLHWMAPELLNNEQYSLKVDVYSFAVVMWQICARKTPYFELSNPMAIMKYVTIDKKRPNMNIIDINCPQKLLELIQKCWDQDPNKRPLFKEIIELLTQIDSTMASQ